MLNTENFIENIISFLEIIITYKAEVGNTRHKTLANIKKRLWNLKYHVTNQNLKLWPRARCTLKPREHQDSLSCYGIDNKTCNTADIQYLDVSD